MPTADVDGLKIHYLTAGDGPAILLLHGYAETSSMWRPLIPRLEGRFRVIAPDLPGIGESDVPASGLDLTTANAHPNAGLRTVGRVNDLAYGNVDSRLERTLTTLQEGTLRGYRADMNGAPGAVALALHHGLDCGVSFVATVPQARRHGLATQVMRSALADAQLHGLTTITLQATELGERLYQQLGLRRLGPMELWEHRR